MKLFSREQWHFQEEITKESAGELINPGRGWYQVYGFDVSTEPDWEELRCCLNPSESLALLLLDIGAYKLSLVSLEALDRVDKILQFFGSHGKELIVRVVYDREGKGLEKEPYTITMIQTHMQQLGPVLLKQKDILYTLQGLFVGSWGEMHGSRFLTQPYLKQLADTLWQAVQGSCFLAVRRPMQRRMIQEERQKNLKMQIGLYNDGMFGSESDLGTYGDENGWQCAWSREKELAFQEEICREVPNGGEAVRGTEQDDKSFIEIVTDLRKMKVSYLNSVYDPVRLEQWKRMVWEEKDCFWGRDGYSYIGCHLGYRYVVRKAELCGGRTGQLRITVENVGFADMYETAFPELVLVKDGIECQSLSIVSDTRTWHSGKRTVFHVSLDTITHGSYRVYLGLRRHKDGRLIEFANEKQENSGKAISEALACHVPLGSLTYS